MLLECTDVLQKCYDMNFVLVIVKTIIRIIEWTVPIIIIVLGTVDMIKIVVKGDDEKTIKDGRTRLIKRIGFGVLIFVIPFLVRLVLNTLNELLKDDSDVNAGSWIDCWNNVGNDAYFIDEGCDNIYENDDPCNKPNAVDTECNPLKSGSSEGSGSGSTSSTSDESSGKSGSTKECTCPSDTSETEDGECRGNTFKTDSKEDCENGCSSNMTRYSAMYDRNDDIYICYCYYAKNCS